MIENLINMSKETIGRKKINLKGIVTGFLL